MSSTSPRSKTTAAHRKRFNPYMRPSRDMDTSRKPTTAPLARRLAMYIENYEVHLEDALWMGSAMVIDEPNSPDGTSVPDKRLDIVASNALITSNAANDINDRQAVGHVSPKKSKLMRSLEKVISKCIERHCKAGHPTTDLLRERISAALEGALEGIEIDNIMSHGSKGGEKRKKYDGKQDKTDDDPCNITRTICGLLSLGTVLREKSETLGLRYKPGSLAGMPGGYPTETLSLTVYVQASSGKKTMKSGIGICSE
ncbi:hypothetical protein EDD22DRAFT_853563 [Suillus occidentalis]|nr:hypothetical protein EDD22DRAFT_853563 [Suillus occidentalis]